MTDDSLLNDITPALEVHLREYEMLRNQYNQDSSMQHQLTNYAIAITAGAGSLFFIGEPSLASQVPFILLVISLILTFICFAIIDLGYSIQDISTYIQKKLKPKIQKLVGEKQGFEYCVLEWEEEYVKISGRLAIRGVTSMGKYAVAYIPAVGMIIAFVAMKPNASWIAVETALYWLSIVAAALLPIVGALNVVHMIGRGKEETPEKEKSTEPDLVNRT
jgi:hypothetical protein